MAKLIDGKAIAARTREQVAADVAAFEQQHGRPPGLATVLVGEDEASRIYVAGKHRACEEAGITPFGHVLAADATVTVAHSRTRDLAAVCRGADVLIVAVGRDRMVRADWVAPGATVIDVGMNRSEDGLNGDVAFDEVAEVAGAITPVPGGVGPMTIAMLLRNTLEAAELRLARTGAAA